MLLQVGLALGIAWDVHGFARLWQVPKALARISPGWSAVGVSKDILYRLGRSPFLSFSFVSHVG
jgi:hypothetical protein